MVNANHAYYLRLLCCKIAVFVSLLRQSNTRYDVMEILTLSYLIHVL